MFWPGKYPSNPVDNTGLLCFISASSSKPLTHGRCRPSMTERTWVIPYLPIIQKAKLKNVQLNFVVIKEKKNIYERKQNLL